MLADFICHVVLCVMPLMLLPLLPLVWSCVCVPSSCWSCHSAEPLTRPWPRFGNFHNWLNEGRSGGRRKAAQRRPGAKLSNCQVAGEYAECGQKHFRLPHRPQPHILNGEKLGGSRSTFFLAPPLIVLCIC